MSPSAAVAAYHKAFRDEEKSKGEKPRRPMQLNVALKRFAPGDNSADCSDPESCVDPEGWLILDFDDEGGGDDDEPCDEDDEHGGSVAGINEGVILLASLAGGPQGQESGEEFSLAAARAFAGESAQDGLGQCWPSEIGHQRFFRKRKGRPGGRPCLDGVERAGPGQCAACAMAAAPLPQT